MIMRNKILLSRILVFLTGLFVVVLLMVNPSNGQIQIEEFTKAIRQTQSEKKRSESLTPAQMEVLGQFDITAKVAPVTVRYAVLIGYDINERNPGRLPEFSTQDVEKMGDFLEKNGYEPQNIVRMTSQMPPFVLQPRRENILAVLKMVSQQAMPQDSIFVMVSGIGGMAEGELWFLPKGATSLKDEPWISQHEILDILRTSPCESITVMNLTDRYQIHNVTQEGTTVSQQQRIPQKGPGGESVSAMENEKPYMTLMSSCSADQESLESREKKLDLFLTCFFDSAKETRTSGNPLSFHQIFPRAKQKTESRAKEKSKVQIPEMVQIEK